jgi:hypothetical protein
MRRTTAVSFNEQAHRVVWTETLRQGDAMLRSWLAAGEKGITSTAADARSLAMNVILRAGFGKSYEFRIGATIPDTKKQAADGAVDFRDALNDILRNAMLIIGFGPANMGRLGLVSGKFAYLDKAWATFKQYMVDTLNAGEQKGQEAQERGNLLANLSRALHEDKQLSEEEGVREPVRLCLWRARHDGALPGVYVRSAVDRPGGAGVDAGGDKGGVPGRRPGDVEVRGPRQAEADACGSGTSPTPYHATDMLTHTSAK